PAAPGHHEGTVAGTLDAEDEYALDAPPGVVIRVTLEGDLFLSASLVDPAGDVRASGSLTRGPVDLSAAAPGGGAWTLRVQSAAQGVSPQPYAFDVAFEPHAHFAPWSAPPGRAAAVSVGFPASGYARLEASLAVAAPGSGAGSLVTDDVIGAATSGFSVSVEQVLLATSPAEGAPSVAVHREGPTDLDVPTPGLVSLGGGLAGTVALESGRGPFTGPDALQRAWIGLASNGNVSLSGWLAWDDEAPGLVLVPATSFSLRASDLAGSYVEAGGLATGDDLHGSWTAPAGTLTVVENGITPLLAQAPTRLVVTDPSGRVDALTGQYAIRWPYQAPPAGAWSVDLRHTDGVEGDQPRFFAAAYAFPATASA